MNNIETIKGGEKLQAHDLEEMDWDAFLKEQIKVIGDAYRSKESLICGVHNIPPQDRDSIARSIDQKEMVAQNEEEANKNDFLEQQREFLAQLSTKISPFSALGAEHQSGMGGSVQAGEERVVSNIAYLKNPSKFNNRSDVPESNSDSSEKALKKEH